jgi:hypothetical protein
VIDPRGSASATGLLCSWLALAAEPAAATCNVIPEATGRFTSSAGEVATPFAQPGDVVTIHRTAAFAPAPDRNRVVLTFRHADGSTTTVDDVAILDPLEATDCVPSRDCTGDRCSCLGFRFPDTDAEIAPPDDGRPLTGPVAIRVETDGIVVAQIDALVDPETGSPRTDLVHFLALPPRNDFSRLIGAPSDGGSPCGIVAPRAGPALGTVDDAGNLFVPLDMRGVRPVGNPPFNVLVQAPIVEAHVPGATLPEAADIQLFSPEGHRLPPLVRQAGTRGLVGIADGPFSVLRVDHGALPAGVARAGGRGPVVIGGVEGYADPCKRVDTSSVRFGDRTVVYENDECNPLSDDAYCTDLNGDGDRHDHFLRAFDMRVPNAEPVTIDQIDEVEELTVRPGVLAPGSPCASYLGAFGLPLGEPAYGLYRFVASDELAAFTIAETSCFDLDGDDQVGGPPVRTGAFDIGRRARVWPAEGSDRVELAGGVLAFTASGGPTGRGLFVYDASQPAPVATLVPEPSFGSLAPSDVARSPWGYLPYGPDVFDVTSLAVHGRWVGFIVGTAFGLGGPAYVYDVATRALVDLDPAGDMRFTGPLALSDRWLAAETDDRGVVVYDLQAPAAPPRTVCRGRFRPFGPSISDSIIPCVSGNRLHAYLPFAPDGPAEVDLDLAVYAGADVQVEGDELVVGVSEELEGRDLDGDGDTRGSPFGAFVVHTFDATTETITNLGVGVLFPRAPFLHRLQGLLVVVSPEAVTRTGRVGFTFFPRPPPPPRPDNDECRTALPITATPFRHEVGTSTALTPAHDPVLRCVGEEACNDGRGRGSVWYTFAAPAGGTVTVDAGGSDFPVVLNAQQGTCRHRAAVGCSTTGRLVFEAAGGFPYLIEMAGARCDDAGRATLEVRFDPRFPTTTLPTSTTVTTTTASSTSLTTSTEAPTSTTATTTTTTLAAECRTAADCTDAPPCAEAACPAGRCEYAVRGFDGVGCALAGAQPPPACGASPVLAARLDRITARASRLVAEAGRAPRPRRRRVLLAKAGRVLTAGAGPLARLARREGLTRECEHDTVRLMATLARAVEELPR